VASFFKILDVLQNFHHSNSFITKLGKEITPAIALDSNPDHFCILYIVDLATLKSQLAVRTSSPNNGVNFKLLIQTNYDDDATFIQTKQRTFM
jgi:hypothetical protein